MLVFLRFNNNIGKTVSKHAVIYAPNLGRQW